MKTNVNIPPGTDFNNDSDEETQNDNAPPMSDLDKLLNESEIDPNEELQPPQAVLQMFRGNDYTNIGTIGNFLLIIGKAKSRKTFLMVLLLSAIIKGTIFGNRIKGCLTQPQTEVLYFDTEQTKYDVYKAFKRICKLAGVEIPQNLHVYCLRKYPPSKRLELIEHAINSNPNIGLVAIDGIKDLITSINDEVQATMISSKLLQWTEEKNIHIISVLHQNKGDLNARGHLGSELVNKAETVLSVTKSDQDKEISIVEAEYCRDKEPESFAFEIDLDGIPQEAEDWKKRNTKVKNKMPGDDLDDMKMYSLLKEAFSNEPMMGYGLLTSQLKIAFKKQHGGNIGDNKVKDIITLCKNKKWVMQDKPNGKYSLVDADKEI